MVELIRQNHDLFGLIVLLAVSVVANVLLHWVIVCRRLYRHGAGLPTGLLFWRVFAELRRYRDLTSGSGRPLTFFYMSFILAWFNLLLAFALALRALWLQSHIGSY